MDDVINSVWMSDDSLCIEISRDLLESGAEVRLTVEKVSGIDTERAGAIRLFWYPNLRNGECLQ